MRIRTIAIGAAVVAIGVFAPSSPASARWVYRNGPVNIDLPTSNDSAYNVLPLCTNRISGRVSLSLEAETPGFDLDAVVLPAAPFAPQTVEIYASSVYQLGGSVFGDDGLHVFGTQVVLQPILTQTVTPKALVPPEVAVSPATSRTDVYYAAAAFDIVPPAGAIKPGDSLLIRRADHTMHLTTTAIDCPPTIVPKIDIAPGIHPNLVVPWLRTEVLPVRLFGSATFKVSTVTNVKLGNAPAAVLPPRLAFLGAARDYNRDGFADRDYYFSPAATGIKCSSKSATLTGKTAMRPFSAKDSVKPIWC